MRESKEEPQDPVAILQTAIEELDMFARSTSSRLTVGINGRLVAAQESPWKRVMGLARDYIAPFFSNKIKETQAKRLNEIKKAILQARDIVKSHAALIEKFKEGDEAQQHLAAYAISTIRLYNSVVAPTPSPEIDFFRNSLCWKKLNVFERIFCKILRAYAHIRSKNLTRKAPKTSILANKWSLERSLTTNRRVYNYDRHRLLSDHEIRGQPIELPRPVSVKYDSHRDSHPAQKMLKQLSQTLVNGATRKSNADICSTHKKTTQFMRDTFHMKAIRLIQSHLPRHSLVTDILPLVKKTPIEMDEESRPTETVMRQLLEVGPGFHILVTGCFNRLLSDSKFMSMPILDSFRISFQLTHTGFPYPSQHTGWALSDHWINAHPLRPDQVPLFQQVDERRKRLTHHLLFDQQTAQHACRQARAKREVFDLHRDLFLPLHHRCQLALKQGMLHEIDTVDPVLEAFYQEAAQAPSAFDLIVQTQEQISALFIQQPFQSLEEEWLGTAFTPLRTRSPQEKFQTACLRLEQRRSQAQGQVQAIGPCRAYILQQGYLLGKAFQPIGLQYESEKMGFSPPLLSDFERKLQAVAFQQLLTFVTHVESGLDVGSLDKIKQELLRDWSRDVDLLSMATIEEDRLLPSKIVDELEMYFNSRFYTKIR